MRSIQTRPISDDGDFGAIQRLINPLMAKHGFPMLTHKGSTSWLAGAGYPRQRNEVFFKLLYRGKGKSYQFGIRQNFVQSVEKWRVLRWPNPAFAVMPIHDVVFAGFDIQPGDGEHARQRIEKLFMVLPEPRPDIELPPDTNDDGDFDQQLENL